MEYNNINKKVILIQNNNELKSDFIQECLPLIKKEVANFVGQNQNDELSIALIAFNDAIDSYQIDKGNFINYAKLIIKNRLIDNYRKEKKHQEIISLDDKFKESNTALIDLIPDKKNDPSYLNKQQLLKEEIIEFKYLLKQYDLTFQDLLDNNPKQKRTFDICQKVIIIALENQDIILEVVKTKRLPIKKILEISNLERKTIERHRKYLIGLLLIYTNGFFLIREHLQHLYPNKGGYLA